jgi:hypothetical protein
MCEDTHRRAAHGHGTRTTACGPAARGGDAAAGDAVARANLGGVRGVQLAGEVVRVRPRPVEHVLGAPVAVGALAGPEVAALLGGALDGPRVALVQPRLVRRAQVPRHLLPRLCLAHLDRRVG